MKNCLRVGKSPWLIKIFVHGRTGERGPRRDTGEERQNYGLASEKKLFLSHLLFSDKTVLTADSADHNK